MSITARGSRQHHTPPGDTPIDADLCSCLPDEVFARLGSRPEGLSPAEVLARTSAVGANELHAAPRPHLVRHLVANLTHLMALLLWVGGLLALFAGLPQLTIAVWAVNLINGAFSTWQEHRAERAVQALSALLPATARVLRDGMEVEVGAPELVPGDVLLLAEGARISADARLVQAHELRVDQSALTGESRPVRRTADPLPPLAGRPTAEELNQVFAGTLVTSGRGTAVITATGMRTAFGGIAELTQSVPHELSPLQRELATLTRVVGAIAILIGLLFLALAQLLTTMPLQRGLVFALGMIVAFVPEGLLPTVTLSLALATQRMAARRALVKRLSAVEALGSTTVICTDKTGTLTANQMTVRALVVAGSSYEVTGTGYQPHGELRTAGRPIATPPVVRELLTAGALANDARLCPGTRPVGDPTEVALLVAAVKLGVDPEAAVAQAPRIAEHPFDPARRRMSTIHRPRGSGQTDRPLVLYAKGAPVALLACCASIRTPTGTAPLDDDQRARVLAANDELSCTGLRVLGVACRDLPLEHDASDTASGERELTWLGLLGMLDPPRESVAAAVATCHRAGIRILMITGDYGLTAESIARRVGIVPPDQPVRIIDGEQLDLMDDATLQAAVAEPVIVARATASHKLRVVSALQARGEIVAVTGDGVNDAPALKRADIGVAMGASGTDVAREAADMVLLDDDFATIVAAIEEGRAVYANVRRFTGYIFTSNTPEAVPFVLFGLSGGRIPIALDVMHILAVDLGTDLVPALALGAEPAEPGVMDHPPRRPDEHLVTPALLRRAYLWLGPAQAALTMAAFWFAFRAQGLTGGWTELPAQGPAYRAATAAALAAVVTTQIGNLFAHRSSRARRSARTDARRALGKACPRSEATAPRTTPTTASGPVPAPAPHPTNHLIGLGIASELMVITAIVYAPPLQRLVGTSPFPPWLWVPLLALSPTLLVLERLRAAVVVRFADRDGRRRRPPAATPRTGGSEHPTVTGSDEEARR